MKGIILAGGAGSRLYPITQGISKQLLPIYDKPMIYYPLSVLMLAGIREILIITTEEDQPAFIRLLGDGSQWGVSLSYKVQFTPDGIAKAFLIGKEFIGEDDVCLILGDNIFYGDGLTPLLKDALITVSFEKKACLLGYYVSDPERYGVAEFNKDGEVVSIEEKPENPKSNYAVVGLYFYPNDVIQKSENIKPSERGELEITCLNQVYLKEKRLKLNRMGRGFAWLDTGTHESLLEAGSFIQTIEARQGLKVACLEEIAYKKHWITIETLNEAIARYDGNVYGNYLKQIEKDISYNYLL
ncbi:glucose-1-phosphate thymidylyltransferase RfbA [Ancylomarina sp. DW003]|nr:glucose-1-phosphate thymidylyltransferase RfbA [Ancylomarina sp. DW003]MDE5423394.1 glucose-1-phosphate thymidylyltransferase RfbA [Ancylomarina sp. DW003]